MSRSLLFAAFALAALAPAFGAPLVTAVDCSRTTVGFTPLNDLGAGQFQGQPGGLYPDGSNDRPARHNDLGLALARLAVPRNGAGLPDPVAGKSIFLSVGMSNTNAESQRFAPLAAADPLRHPQVQFVNGAIGGWAAENIADPDAAYWALVDQRLAAAGATGAQVQAVWLKEANRQPNGPFPQHAERLQADLQTIVEILKERFPNLWLVYLSSRIYAGYATTTLNPEPFAYTSGFSVKWLIEDELDGVLPLSTQGGAAPMPWLSWGPYLWADGVDARSDGLTWVCSDFQPDGTHPAATGAEKVAQRLLDFVHDDDTARVWYRFAGRPPA